MRAPVWYYGPPGLQLFLEGNGGVCRACGRQAHVSNCSRLDLRQYMPLEACLCFRAVEEHASDAWVVAEERSEVICDLRIASDHCVQAAFTRTGVQDIPKRDAGGLEGFDPARICTRRVELEERGHDAQKRILRMRVILASRERCLARHAAQHEHFGILIGDRRETMDSRHLAWSFTCSPSRRRAYLRPELPRRTSRHRAGCHRDR